MKTIFHVGMSKAGSTALQVSLLSSRTYLLGCGVLYPQTVPGMAFNNHEILTQPFDTFNRLPRRVRELYPNVDDVRVAFEELVAAIREQIKAHEPNCLVLSAEHMWRQPSDEAIEATRRSLRDLVGPAPIVPAYIRRPSSRYLSGLQQALKSGQFSQPSRPSYRRPIASLEAVFGERTVVPLNFDRSQLKGGSIVSDFADRFLKRYEVVSSELVTSGRSNQSVSAAAMKLLNEFAIRKNSGGTECVEVQNLRRDIQKAERELELTKPKIRPEAADRIDYSSTEPLWLRDHYGIEFRDFDYSRLEKGEIHELKRNETLDRLIHVDPDEFQRLVDHLGRRSRDKAVRSFTRQFGTSPRPFFSRLFSRL